MRSTKASMASLLPAAPGSRSLTKSISCSLLLTESDVFLSGFDTDESALRHEHMTEAVLLRGTLQMDVLRPVKIRAIELELTPHAYIDWPQGVTSVRREAFKGESFKPEVLTLFNAMDGELSYENYASPNRNNLAHAGGIDGAFTTSIQNPARFCSREQRRLSLQIESLPGIGRRRSQSSVFGNKSFSIFYPGTYNYAFAVPIYRGQVESIRLPLAAVKWELRASVHRAGLLASNAFCNKEISVIRLPDPMSLFGSQPIVINRTWEGRLRCQILVSGSCVALGSTIPIFAKLTPLNGKRLQKMEVYITETVRYWSMDKRATRRAATRKVLLFEKAFVMQKDLSKESTEIEATGCGELITWCGCQAKDAIDRKLASDSGQTCPNTELHPKSSSSIGDPDFILQSPCACAEIEANVQIPTCAMMAKDRKYCLHPDHSWKNAEVNHWIEILISVQGLEKESMGKCPQSDKITAQSPIAILNCRASPRSTGLPVYPGPETEFLQFRPVCGCPDAETVLFIASSSNIPSPRYVDRNSLDEQLLTQYGAEGINHQRQMSVTSLAEPSSATDMACLDANVTTPGTTAEAGIATGANGMPPPGYDQVAQNQPARMKA